MVAVSARRGRRGVVLAVVWALVVAALAVPALAAHYGVSLEGSKFQIESNANLVVDASATVIKDWVNVTESRRGDKPTGGNDDSYSGGVKEDTPCPTETTGSIPNNKSDLRNFGLYHEPGSAAGDDGFLHLFWNRVSDPSGTTLMDFEFNQSQTACPSGSNVVRTPKDMLIEYSIAQGGATATMTVRRWTAGGVWGSAMTFAAGDAIGTTNTSVIAAANADGLLPAATSTNARTFGEASIDLNSVFDDTVCQSFGSAMLKSRSSDSFSSQLKDFIDPVPITLTNCGGLQIKKVDAGGNPLPGAKFKVFKDNAPLGAPRTAADTLVATSTTPSVTECTTTANGIGNCIYNSLLIGTSYWVVETAAPTGYQPITAERLIPITSTATVTSEWENQPSEGDVKVIKKDDANNAMNGVRFTLTGTSDLDNAVSRECTTAGTGECTIDGVEIGTYTLAEDVTTIPAGYGSASSQQVTVAAGTQVTKTFTNPRLRGSLTITKRDDDGTPGNLMNNVQFTLSGTSTIGAPVSATCTTGVSNSTGSLPDTGKCSFLNILVGTYELAEGAVPAGYSSDGAFPKQVTVVSATNVAVPVVNPKQRGNLNIEKEDDAGNLMNNVEFSLTGTSTTGEAVNSSCTTGVSNSSGAAVPATGKCSFLNILVGTYQLAEGVVPAGYGKDPAMPKSVTITNGGTETVTVVNPRRRGNLVITKTDDAGNLMNNVEFTLKGTSTTGSAIDKSCVTGVSNSTGVAVPATGKCSFLNVLVGSYTLAEGAVPAGYAKDPSLPKTVAVTHNGTTQVGVANPRLHKVVVLVCHQGTNTLAPSAVTLGGTHDTIATPPSIDGATAADVEAALCALQGFGGKSHETVAPSVNVGSGTHN